MIDQHYILIQLKHVKMAKVLTLTYCYFQENILRIIWCVNLSYFRKDNLFICILMNGFQFEKLLFVEFAC